MNRNIEDDGLVVKSLADELKEVCEAENIPVFDDLCICLIDLKLLRLSKSVGSILSDSNLKEEVVAQCVTDLKENGLGIEILKLQIFWKDKYQSREKVKKIHHQTVFKNVLPLMMEISEGSLIKTIDKDELYRKIVIFIIMFAGLGNPTAPSVIKETQVALSSIFKNTEMDNFLNLSKATKEQQLIEFARLITGIRLFNKDCKKGGEGIDDLPLILTQGVRATKERIFNFKCLLDKRTDQIIKALSQVYTLKEFPPEINDKLPGGYQREEIEEIKSFLVYCRQIESFLKDLTKDLDDSFAIIEELVKRLQINLLKLHDVVRYRVAIATVQVFPLFLQLSNVWVEMQEEVDILSEINNHFVDLISEIKLPEPTTLEIALTTDADTDGASESSDISDASFELSPGVKICTFSGHEYLQYKGFCAWALVSGEGYLLTGKVAIGILEFSGRFYSFSSADAAYKWAKDPKLHIKAALNIVKPKPELIKLLNLFDDLKASVEAETLNQEVQRPKKENAEVQTDLHPIDSYISKDYTFSEWELKRRAIKLADLTMRATKSQQTMKGSMFRANTAVQVQPGKSRSTQTRKDRGCNYVAFPKFVCKLRTDLIEDEDLRDEKK